jgi:YVTN family beta-propeller protein
MSRRKLAVRTFATAIVGVAVLMGIAGRRVAGASAAVDDDPPFTSSTRSSPIAITSDDSFVWSVNPDNDSVSVFDVRNDANQKLAEIGVGKEPWCVAITSDDRTVYVTNMESGTVSVINARQMRVTKTIEVGAEPFGCALTPDDQTLFVANQSSNTVSVIDTKGDEVEDTIRNVGEKPHGIAISEDGKNVFVTQFLALKPANDPRPLTQSEGRDDGREGRVTVINAQTRRVVDTVVLNPIDVPQFLSDGNTLEREPLTMTFNNPTGAFPNLLESITIKDGKAYVPGTCSSPNGPFRFNVNVQSCLSTIDLQANNEAFPTFNMNVGVGFEPVGVRLFNTNPFAIAFKRSSAEGFVALGATDRLLRVTLGAGGAPTINAPANAMDPSGIIRIPLKEPAELNVPDPNDVIGSKNPRGLVINSKDTRAYVMSFTSRDIAVVDISGDPSDYRTLDRIASADLPPGGIARIAQRGKQLFNSSIGPEGQADNSTRPAGRMSDFGWGTCYSCHPQALTDSVTWMFADGPRQAISMESTFEFGAAQIVNGAPALPASHQRALNWSAVRDEVQDFTRNIRAVSGGGGLVFGIPEGVAGLGQVPDLTPTANTGLSADLDAIATYLAVDVRAPISPLSSQAPTVQAGRVVFGLQGCQNCHGGRNWTISQLDFTPPPSGTEIVDAQLIRFLCRVDTFDPALFTDGVSNEIRANNVNNVQARGVLGFNVPSLISVFASAPYLHSGDAPTLDAVLENVIHRNAGRTGGIDLLQFTPLRSALAQFMRSIDRGTTPFLNVDPPENVCGPQ